MRALQFKSWPPDLKPGCDHHPGPPEEIGLMLALSRFLLTFQQHLPKPRGVMLSNQGWGLSPHQLCAMTHWRLRCLSPTPTLPPTLPGSVFLPNKENQLRMGSILGAGG